jgi:hypothetical protein
LLVFNTGCSKFSGPIKTEKTEKDWKMTIFVIIIGIILYDIDLNFIEPSP